MNPWNTTFYRDVAFNDDYVYARTTRIPIKPSEGVTVEFLTLLAPDTKIQLTPQYFYTHTQVFNRDGKVIGDIDREQGISSRKILCDSRFPPTANSIADTGAISPEITNEE